jgi:putative oxidoreductase
MNIALWIAQIILAVLYVLAGVWKLMGEGSTLEEIMPGFSLTLIRVVGIVELLAGLGMVLPAIVRRWRMVAAWAGIVVAVESVLFVVYHLSLAAIGPAVAVVVLGALAAFVAWGRLR